MNSLDDLNISPKAMAVMGGLLALLSISVLTDADSSLRVFSGPGHGQSAAVSNAGWATGSKDTSDSLRKNNLFSVKALPEFRLFAPVWKTISPLKPLQSTKPAALQKQAPKPQISTIPASIITSQAAHPMPAPSIINPISIPTPKPTVNPLSSQFSEKNNVPATAVVNIICSVAMDKASQTMKNISSSGVLISATGLILTNAHVGIHPFIAEYGKGGMSCKIRSGSPALTKHALSFIYISPTWTVRHRGETSGIVSIDSGNADFAILKASMPSDILKFASPVSIRNTGAINPLYLFSHDSFDLSFSPGLAIGQSVTAIGYPIESGSAGSLTKKEDHLAIRDLFEFSGATGGKKHDLVETSASSIGKNGASGGAIADVSNYLIAILSNVIPSTDPDMAYIRAITLDHINASLLWQTGINLHDLIEGDGTELKEIFESRYLNSVTADLL